MRAPRIEKIALADGGYQYVMDDGRVVWEYGELSEDAPLEVREHRRAWLAYLDLHGHQVVSSIQGFADLLWSEAHDDDD